ncbi:MAG: GcrA family cell cycle regulator [Alphaproteobacteria bacterium]|nr:GcrA family cell cycle regulator [Alphaproteobacteria bacterium]
MAKETWSPVVLNKMKAFLSRGMSTSEIGKKIGMSKNAVVGKLNRLGWNAKAAAPAKSKPAPAKPKTAAKPAPKKAPAKAPAKKAAPVKKPAAKPTPKKPEIKKPAPKPAPAAKPLPKANSKTLAMHQRIIQHSLEMANLRPDQCRWPIGDPDSEKFHFCGKSVFVGKPYCYDHCLNAYQMQPPKKK